MYNILNFLSGFIEIGSVFYGFSCFGIMGAFCGALCYQLGNIVPVPYNPSIKTSRIFAFAGTSLAMMGLFNSLFAFPSILFLSISLQSSRNMQKKLLFLSEKNPQGSKIQDKKLKRFLRVIGFLFGFCFNKYILVLCAILIMFSSLKSMSDASDMFPVCKKCRLNTLYGVLVLHEIHYFVYCYSMILITCIALKNIFFFPVLGASIVFALSWLPYLLSVNIYRNCDFFIKQGYKKTFIIAHSLLAILLLVMFFCLSQESGRFMWLGLLLWLLTGLFGTTEFCIEGLAKEKGIFDKNEHALAENIGHISGVVLSALIYSVSGSLAITVAAGAVFALSAMTGMIFVSGRNSK